MVLHRLALLLPLLLAACGAPAAVCGIRPHAEIPVRVVRATPLVAAQMNGAPVSLVLDTGADRTVLTEAASRRVGLTIDPNDIRRGAGAGGVAASFAARVRRFDLAGLAIPDHPVLTLPRPLFAPEGETIDGLLPALVLSAFDVDMNLPAGRATLYGGTVCGDTAIPPWTQGFVALPADFSNPPRIHLRVQAGEATLRALLDTGAQRSVITPAAAAAAGITPAMLEAAPLVALRGIGPNPAPARAVRLPSLRIGPEQGRDIPVLVASSGLDKVDMILGMDYLGVRRLWLSYARQQVYMMLPPGR